MHNHTDFLRAVRDGRLTATATPIHRGRSQQLWLVEVTDGDGGSSPAAQVRLQNLADSDRRLSGSRGRVRHVGSKRTPTREDLHVGCREPAVSPRPDGDDARTAVAPADRGRGRRRHQQAARRRPAWSPTTPASSTPRPARRRSPTSTATPASCATAATRSSSWPSSSTFLEVSYLLIYGELPDRRRSWTSSPSKIRRHTLLHEDLKRLLRRLPARRAPDAGAVLGGVGAVDLLPGLRSTRSTTTQVELSTDPAAGQAADDRRLRLQEVGRPAVPLPGQLAGPGRELPADDLRLPGRALRGRPGAGPRRWTCCSSCTPTTSRTARPRRCGWSARRRPTCSPRSRPASTPCSARCTAAPTSRCWRCSRSIRADGGDVDALRRAGQEQGGRRQADGLRPPGLQELRPARRDRQEDRRRGARRRSASATTLLDIAMELEEHRARRRLLHRAQALPERRLLHRPDLPGDGLPDPDVHRAVRASAGCPAGSPSGAR